MFKALRLFFLPNFPDPTFIPCPTSIPEARVFDLISFLLIGVKLAIVALLAKESLEQSVTQGLTTTIQSLTIVTITVGLKLRFRGYCVLKVNLSQLQRLKRSKAQRSKAQRSRSKEKEV